MINPSKIADMTAYQIVDKTTGQILDMTAPIDHSLARASGVQRSATGSRTTVKEGIIVASRNSNSSADSTLSKFHRTSISNRNSTSRVEPRTTICGDINTCPSTYQSSKARARDSTSFTTKYHGDSQARFLVKQSWLLMPG